MSDEFRGKEATVDHKWRIVYPTGDRSRLAIAEVMYYEADDYALASSKEFDYEFDARDHMKTLAKENNLKYKYDGLLD